MGWSVAVTRPHQEARAAEHLRQQGYDFYLPRTLSKTKRVCPLFPRYVFVALRSQWYSLLGTFGISCVLFSGDHPAIVHAKVVDGLRAMERDGLVRLPDRDESAFKIDQRVRIIGGVMSGLVGLYKGQSSREREKILLSNLGLVHLPLGNLAVVVE